MVQSVSPFLVRTAGIAVVIWVGQWAAFFGLPAPLGAHFHSKLWQLLQALPALHLSTTLLATGCLCILLTAPRVPGLRRVPAPLLALLVAGLSLFFQKTATGRALRAVADDHQAAQSIGIPLNRIWVIVWCVAGVVALVAGMIWGSKLGVQFSLATVALRALPVVILGGLTSVPGAIIGGLIIGVGEKLSEVYLGPFVGGGIEIWFAYVLALVFLLFRPQGLFGEKIIDRV